MWWILFLARLARLQCVDPVADATERLHGYENEMVVERAAGLRFVKFTGICGQNGNCTYEVYRQDRCWRWAGEIRSQGVPWKILDGGRELQTVMTECWGGGSLYVYRLEDGVFVEKEGVSCECFKPSSDARCRAAFTTYP